MNRDVSHSQPTRTDAGFTLLEVLVAMAITMIVVLINLNRRCCMFSHLLMSRPVPLGMTRSREAQSQ